MGKSIGVQTTLNFFIGRGQKDMKTLAIIFRQRPQLQGSIGQKTDWGCKSEARKSTPRDAQVQGTEPPPTKGSSTRPKGLADKSALASFSLSRATVHWFKMESRSPSWGKQPKRMAWIKLWGFRPHHFPNDGKGWAAAERRSLAASSETLATGKHKSIRRVSTTRQA